MKFVYCFLVLLCVGNCFGTDALEQLNARRAKSGLQPFKPDPVLQAAAERSAQQQARSGAMYHCLHIGSRSGVGMASGSDVDGRRFNTCYSMSGGGGYAGAAAVVGRNGTYYALDIRNSPSPQRIVKHSVAKPVVKQAVAKPIVAKSATTEK